MKKVLLSSLVTLMSVTMIAGGFAQAESSSSSLPVVADTTVETDVSSDEAINVLEDYVFLEDDGTIGLRSIPQNIYDTYGVAALEAHLATINQGVLAGELTVDENLEITPASDLIEAQAVYGKWTYHWWGYDRKFNNKQTKAYVEYLDGVVAGGAIVTGVGAYFPPVAAVSGVSTGYFALLKNRVNANNKGRGVLVECTWVAIFNVSPL